LHSIYQNEAIMKKLLLIIDPFVFRHT